MNIRIIIAISCLSFLSIHAMWSKFGNWFEDPTKHIALVNWYNEGPQPTVSLIIFKEKQKRKVERYNLDNKYFLLGNRAELIPSTIYLPISAMNDWKESKIVEVDVQNNGQKETFICDQKAITPTWNFEERLTFFKNQVKND